jgi:hypothetical protein
MQVELFKSLRSIHISEEQATKVVSSVEEHIGMKVNDANTALRADVAALGARLETEIGAIKSILESQRWIMSAIIVLLAIIGLAPAFARLFH